MTDFAKQLAQLQGMAIVSSETHAAQYSNYDNLLHCSTHWNADDNDTQSPQEYREDPTEAWANRDLVPLMSRLCQSLDAIPVDELTDKILLSALRSAVDLWFDKQDWHEDEADLARTILFRLEEEELRGNLFNQERYVPLEPRNYVSAIHAYAQCHDSSTAAQKAESILNHMDERAKTGDAQFIPNRFAINTAIGAYAKSTQEHAPLEAERLLKRLEDEYEETGDESVRPSSRSYGKVIDAWSRSKQKGAIKSAMVVLKHMELQFESGNVDTKPNTVCYSTLIFALAKQDQEEGSAEMAQEIFNSMLSHYEAGLSDFEPSEDIFSALIDLWIKSESPQGAERAYRVLLQMKDFGLRGDTRMFNSVINALADQDDIESLDKAESVLRTLEADPYLITNYASYHNLLKAFYNRTAIDRAEQLWKRWQQDYLAGRTRARPEAFGFGDFHHPWAARSMLRHKAEITAAAKANSVRFWREASNRDVANKKRKATSDPNDNEN